MADSIELSVTQPIQPINNHSNSSQHSPLISKPSPNSENGLHKVGIRTSLALIQDATQYTLDHRSSTSIDLRSSASFQEDSDTGNSPSVPIHDPGNKPTTNTLQVSMSSCVKNPGGDGKYSRTTKLPRWFRISKQGKTLRRFRNHQSLQSETTIEPLASADIVKIWKWEVISCVLAISMLGSMFGVLHHYDGQRIPDWGTVINLSTLVALMATILRATLGFVMAEIIGQAKWNYFAGNGRLSKDPPMRRLIETSRFSDASQGSISALRLLPTIIRDPATSLAIIVMIVLLGTGSFVQQAIQTQSCQFTVDSVNASLPISRDTTVWTSASIGPFGPIDVPNALAALISAFAPDNEEIGSPISAECPTGNCTFQNSIDGVYGTLGVCSSCTDTSSLITLTERIVSDTDSYLTNHTLPNGMFVESSLRSNTTTDRPSTQLSVSTSPQLGLDWAGDLVSLDMKALSKWAFANVTILSPTWFRTNTGYTDYVAATCTIYPCLRSYNATIVSGELDEVLVNTVPAVLNVAAMVPPNDITAIIQQFEGGWQYRVFSFIHGAHLDAVQSPCLVNDTVWTKANQSATLDMQRLLLVEADPNSNGARSFQVENFTAPAECIHGMDYDTAAYLFSRTMTQKVFNGSCTADSQWDKTDKDLRINCGETYWLSRLYDDNGTTAGSIMKRIEAFTDRLSNKMRMGLMNDPETVYGQVQQATVCSRIDYRWLAFPAVLVAVTSGLLAWTMYRSSRNPGREMVWKTSILPFLFYSDRFVIQNGEDMAAGSAGSPRGDGLKEPLLDFDQMEAEAKQRLVRFNAFE